MPKTTIKNLVSLIIEQINNKAIVDQLFPPDADVYIDNPLKYPELFDSVEDVNEPELPAVSEPVAEPELQMAAEAALNEARDFEYDKETLPEPMKIPAEELTKGARTPAIPRIVCVDPETDQFVEGVVIGDLVLTTPSGKKILVFYNHGLEQKIDRANKRANYVVLADNRFMMDKPRGKAWGKPIERDVQSKLAVAPPDETDIEKQKREGRLNAIKEGNAKRYGIFPIINSLFSNPDVLDHLDITLIPETWATPIRTEHTTNKIVMKKFGGTSSEIDADFIAVRDMKDVDSAIDGVMELRAELAMGDEVDKREREVSKAIPRQHANYIYRGGNWHAKQRVHDENFFQRSGGKTPVYELLSKNIQEGLATVNIRSTLSLNGEVQGDVYLLKATFKATLNARNMERGSGEEVGDLFPPIVVGLRKPLVDSENNPIDPETFTLENNTEFFVDQGRTTSDERKTGFLPQVIETLGNEIKTRIDPDEVLATMIQLVQNAVDQGDPDVPHGNDIDLPL